MNTTDLHRAAITLRKGELHRIHDGAGQRIEALSGALWVTIDNDLRDIVGDEHRRIYYAMVSALDDASFALLEPIAPRRAA